MKKLNRLFSKLSLSILLSVAILALVAPSKAYANETDSNDYECTIWDTAELLSDEETEKLFESMYPLLEYGNVVFYTTTLESYEDYESVCENTYYDLYKNEPGVIFQIDMGNRKLTLSASTEMENLIGSERDSIVDNVYTYATDGDYYKCAEECFFEINTVLNDGRIAHKMKYINNAILAVIFALIINFIIIFQASKKTAKKKAIMEAMAVSAVVAGASVTKGTLSKIYSPIKSSGGSSGSGGGGGGFSGGSSSHGF